MSIFEIFSSAKKLIHDNSILRKSEYFLLLFLILSASFLEFFAVGAIIPFTQIMLDNETLSRTIFGVNLIGENKDPFEIKLIITSVFVFILVVSAITRMCLLKFQIHLSYKVAHILGKRIFEVTLTEPFEFNPDRSSSEFVSSISMKANLVARQVVLPGLLLMSNMVIISVMIFGLCFVNLEIVVLVGSALVVSYLGVVKITGKTVQRNSVLIAKNATSIIKVIQESFNSLKDIKITNRTGIQLSEFAKHDLLLKSSQASSQLIGGLPRYIIELIVLLVVTSIIVFLSFQDGLEISSIVATAAAFAFGFQRIAPNMQQAYNQYVTVKTGEAALRDVSHSLTVEGENIEGCAAELRFHEQIELRGLCYSRGRKRIINDVNLTIKKGEKIAIAGQSGAGKTTLLDVFSSILKPTSGEVIIDGIKLTPACFRSWRNMISYVTQNGYFYDESLLFNVTFADSLDEVDFLKIEKILEVTYLNDVVLRLGGIEQSVGENAVKLSGGEKQRLSIARALYRDSEILLLDECSNALDKELEKKVLSGLFSEFASKTILLVSHDAYNFKYCDKVVKL